MEKKTNIRLLIFVFTLLLTHLSLAQQFSLTLDGKSYFKENNKWFTTEIETNTKFEVNKRSITVKLKENVTQEELLKLNETLGVKIERENILGYIDLVLPEDSDCFKIYKILKESGLFEDIHINTFGKTLGEPNDPKYNAGYQYYISNTSGIPDINATEAWGYCYNYGYGIIIAVIDQDVNYNHQDLYMWGNLGWNYVLLLPIGPDPKPGSQYEGHGTNVAGIASAKTSNGVGVAGIAGGWATQGAQIMALRVMYRYGPNSGEVILNNEVVDDAIIYAALNGADIINMSIQTEDNSSIRSAIDFAYNIRGCLVIAAGGNSYSATQLVFPARYVNTMAVGGVRVDWKHYGNKGSQLEISGPAESIYATDYSGSGNNTYGAYDGTSQAAPQVAGAAALIWSDYPNLLNFDIRRILKETAFKNWSLYNSNEFGEGLLKVDAALDYPYYMPNKPTGVTISAPIGGHPTISWNSVSGADNYKVYRSSENNRLDLHVAATTSNTSWTDNYVTVANPKFANYKYYYRVTTVDDDFESAVSNEVNCSSNSMWKTNDATNNEKMIYEYNLANNYPNPFNPVTIIKYSISNIAADFSQRVVIKVYNILGMEVKILVNEVKQPGNYEVKFDATNLPSGIYFYTIKTEGFTDTKKMILLR